MKRSLGYRLLAGLLILLLLIPTTAMAAPSEGENVNDEWARIDAAPQTDGNGTLTLLNAPPHVTARGAIAMDFETGDILFGRDVDTARPLASMTKNMTAFIVYEEIAAGRLTPDTMIRVGQNAVNLSRQHDWHPSTVFHTVGATHSVETMLRLIMLPSHNGACVAMAEHIAGSVPAFVERMNAEARRLELNARFTDSHGGADNRVSPRAMADLVRNFITYHPDILRITAMRSMPFGGANVTNTNWILRPDNQFFFQGGDGFKTGTSAAAGHCLSATAMRGGRRVITVVMNAGGDSGRYGDTTRLLNFGFAELERRAQSMENMTVALSANVHSVRRNANFNLTASLDNVGTGNIAALGGGWIVNGQTIHTFGSFIPNTQGSFTISHRLPADSALETLHVEFFVNLPGGIRRSGVLTLPVSAQAPALFHDIHGHWAYTSILEVVEGALFTGIGEGYFSPDGNMTRAMFVTVLGRTARQQFGIAINGTARTPFTDVAQGEWYSPYVAWAWEEGIVNGISDDLFGTTEYITRQEAATLFYRFMNRFNITGSGTTEANFPDMIEVSDWALDAILEAVRIGLITGLDDGRLAPTYTATRGQVAVIFLRLLHLGL